MITIGLVTIRIFTTFRSADARAAPPGLDYLNLSKSWCGFTSPYYNRMERHCGFFNLAILGKRWGLRQPCTFCRWPGHQLSSPLGKEWWKWFHQSWGHLQQHWKHDTLSVSKVLQVWKARIRHTLLSATIHQGPPLTISDSGIAQNKQNDPPGPYCVQYNLCVHDEYSSLKFVICCKFFIYLVRMSLWAIHKPCAPHRILFSPERLDNTACVSSQETENTFFLLAH